MKLSPKEVLDVVLPCHIALELIPLGLFQVGHANRIIWLLNLMTADGSTRVGDRVRDCARVIRALRESGSWSCSETDLKVLRLCVSAFDAELSRWTKYRLNVAEETLREIRNEGTGCGTSACA